jgi:hypothetical protein
MSIHNPHTQRERERESRKERERGGKGEKGCKVTDTSVLVFSCVYLFVLGL